MSDKNIKHIVLLGSGTSIKEGIDRGLNDFLSDKMAFSLNANYRYLTHTAIVSSFDDAFYCAEVENLKKEKLVIATYRNDERKFPYDNGILLANDAYYDPYLNHGVYSHRNIGVMALSIAAWILQFNGIIWLLGYDFTHDGTKDKNEKTNTHFFQNDPAINYRYGFGLTTFYDGKNGLGVDVFAPYLQFDRLKIFNVSEISRIPYFEKVNYDRLFAEARGFMPDQDMNREVIRQRLLTVGALRHPKREENVHTETRQRVGVVHIQ